MSDVWFDGQGAAKALQAGTHRYRVGDLLIDHSKRDVKKGDQKLQLSPTEYKILFSFVCRSFTKKLVLMTDLLADVYGDIHPVSNSLVKLVSNIRHKLKRADSKIVITLVRNRGYELGMSDGTILVTEVL